MRVSTLATFFVRYCLKQLWNNVYIGSKIPPTCRRHFGSKFKMADFDQDKKLVHAIETETVPIYFSQATHIGQGEIASFTTPSEFPKFAVFYSISAYNSKSSRVDNVRANTKLLGDINKHLCQDLVVPEGRKSRQQPTMSVVHGFSFLQEKPDSFRKQFFILSPSADESLRDFVTEVSRKYEQSGYCEYVLKEGKLLQTRIEVSEDGGHHEEEMMSVEPPSCHPAFLHPDNNVVFQSYNRALDTLKECADMPGVSEVLSAASSLVPDSLALTSLQEKCQHPVIVLEGLDATGKTTLTEKLGEMLSAPVLQSPPPPIRHLRQVFDAQPELIRRAYYSLGNYILAMQVAEEAQTHPVIVDRFWHSTTAYSIATEVGCGDESQLPPRGHHVYCWPSDLLKPHVALLLTVNEISRGARLAGRGMAKTEEEKRLEKSTLFRKRLVEAYLRMENPGLKVIDASGSREEVFTSTLEVLKDFNILS